MAGLYNLGVRDIHQRTIAVDEMIKGNVNVTKKYHNGILSLNFTPSSSVEEVWLTFPDQ